MSELKTIELDILKKNRVYFKCKNNQGYEVKLIVNDASKDLNLGKQLLLVKDVSVRTKYGTDVIYDMTNGGEVKKDEIVTLKAPYNKNLVKKCQDLGGKWDNDSTCWVFSKIVEDKVEELEYIYASEQVNVEIESLEGNFRSCDAWDIAGILIAKATGRDSGAQLCNGISLIKGKINSAGSMKNWGTEIEEGSVFRFKVPKNLLEEFKSEAAKKTVSVKILEN